MAHEIEVGIRRQGIGQPAADRRNLVGLAGHDQVPHQHAAAGHAVGIELQHPDLAVHFGDRLARPLRIVLGLGVAAGAFDMPELEVGHVDVDDALEQFQRPDRVVGAGVVDDGQAQAARHRRGDGLNHLRHHMLRGDEVYVVAAARL